MSILGYIDLHCDSLLRIHNKYEPDNLLENSKLSVDFDGIQGDFEIADSSEIPLLFQALKKAGWSDDLIDKFKSKNVMRVIKEVLN